MSCIPGRSLFVSIVLLFVVAAGALSQQTEPANPADGTTDLEQIHREGQRSQANRESGEDVLGREAWFTFQRRVPYDRIPADMHANGVRAAKAMEQRLETARGSKRDGASALSVNQWEQIGPSNIGGRVRALAVQPGNPQVLYVGAAAGGVWKTTDGGTSWKTTTDTLASLAIGAIAIDYSHQSTVYIGTGENTGNIDSYLGAGIFKSTDAGLTWKNIGLETVGAFSKIAVNRQNSQIIYAATAKKNGGFYRSEDGGATWKRIVTGDVFDLSVNPNNSNELFIGSASSIRHSTDAGKTFTTVNSGLTLTNSLRISVAMAPTLTSRVYALVARDGGTGNNIGEAYVSTNSGATWSLVKQFDQLFFNKQGWYDNCIAVSPSDPGIVAMGGIDVYVSQDGGSNWTNTTRSYFGGTVHPDQHVLEFDQGGSNALFLGNDGGVYGTLDAGNTWQHVSTELPVTQYYAMDIDQTRLYRVYGGSQDNGTHGSYGTAGFPTDWNRVLQGDGFYVVVDLTDPNTIYAEQYNGTPLYRIDANNTNNRSRIDGSISSDADNGDYGYWSTPIAMSPADKKTLYTGRTKLYRSTNRGSAWQALTPGGPGKITAIGLSPFDAQKMMVGSTSTGGSSEARYSTNDGTSWAKSAGIPNRFVTDIVYDPVTADRVYVTLSGASSSSGVSRVFRSDDAGATFKNISGNLPDMPANAIAVDPRDNTHLFVGTDVGMFASVDGGNYWVPFNAGFPLVPVADLRIQNTSHVLFAATHGRSMFKVNITGVDVQPLLITPIAGSTYTTPTTLPVHWAGLVGPVRILISYDGGRTYFVIADNVTGFSDSVSVPLARTNSARIKVVEIGGSGRSVESGDFSLNATVTGTEVGSRGFIAEAIEYRRGFLWATVRGNDSLYIMKTPLIATKSGRMRTDIPGHVIDMAYDDAADRFYLLTANADFSSPKLYRMDSNGVGHGQVPLPEEALRISGVAMAPAGIALITPGRAGEIFVINDSGALVRRSGALLGADDEDRRGLVWDGSGFVQGVIDRDTSLLFPSKLQHMTEDSPLRVHESSPIVLPARLRVDFFGLAFDPSTFNGNKPAFWATDTAGTFYRFERDKFFTSGVDAEPVVVGYVSHEVALGAVTPNPMRASSDIHFTVRSRRAVTLDLYDASGIRVAPIFEGTVEPGDHTAHLDGTGLASGVYYVAISSGAGERDVRPVVVVR